MFSRINSPDIKIFASLLFLLAILSVLPACNTVEGAGKDIEAAGDAISDTARDAKQEIAE